MRKPIPADIGIDAPLRLEVAAELAYPDGSMTANGLRKEHQRGNLTIERVAGKLYTTLGDIADMRKKCREKGGDQAFGRESHATTETGGSPTSASGSFGTADTSKALAAALTTVEALKKRSPTTSPASTFPRRTKASVTPLPSR